MARAIEILRADLIRTLKLLGCPAVSALDPSYVDAPRVWARAASIADCPLPIGDSSRD